MARAPFKFPSVFVGCPYDTKKFKFPQFRAALSRLPIVWYYADTKLRTKHLLAVLNSYLRAVDYCIFDASMWNPNVSLEVGLAEGLGADYYILLNQKLSKDVPSDIQGIQRIPYKGQNGYERDDLLPQIVKYLVSELTHPRNIYSELTGDNKEKKFYFALAILAHFRDNKYLTYDDIRRVGRGTYLRKEAQNEVLSLLETMGFISGTRGAKGRTLKKSIYPRPLRIK